MEMQPMSAHNRELVSGIARRFKLSVQVSDKPGDGNSETAQSSGEFKSVLLLKTPEACMCASAPAHLFLCAVCTHPLRTCSARQTADT